MPDVSFRTNFGSSYTTNKQVSKGNLLQVEFMYVFMYRGYFSSEFEDETV